MSKEPGICDSYVKVHDELEVGEGMGGVGGGKGPCHQTPSWCYPLWGPVLASDSSGLGLPMLSQHLTVDATLSSAEAGVKDTWEAFTLEMCRVSSGLR